MNKNHNLADNEGFSGGCIKLAVVVAGLLLTAMVGGCNRQNGSGFSQESPALRLPAGSGLVTDGLAADEVRTLTAPAMVQAGQGNTPKPDERIVGVVVNHQPRAYPLDLLAEHEVVNDEIAHQPVVITFCPLTESAIVFERTIDGQSVKFEASDDLYQDNLVFSDDKTHSLWSQIEGSAIRGTLKGHTLTVLPSVVTSWEIWHKFHPDSLVMAGPEVGKDPFAAMEKSPAPPFTTANLDSRLPPKTMVLGLLSKDGKSQAFPFTGMSQFNGKALRTTLDGHTYDIVFDPKSRTAGVALDGKHVAAYTGYWFAWAAFHPRSELIAEPMQLHIDEPDNFHITEAMRAVREGQSATLLDDGKVLVAGGDSGGPTELDSAELYDPQTHHWVATGKLAHPHGGQSATLLPDGTVLLAGGLQNHAVSKDAEIYDPKTGTFTQIHPMNSARLGHTATLMPDGTVLIVGGQDVNQTSTSAEIYHPKTRSFTLTKGKLHDARAYHTATLLKDGRVLIVGGLSDRSSFLSSAEIYDPKTGTFSPTDHLMTARQSHDAALLPDGRVLILGGSSVHGTLRSTELYDPKTGRFGPSRSMMIPREGATLVTLPDHRLLIVGGSVSVQGRRMDMASAEFYDPKTGEFSPAGKMDLGRYKPTLTLLKDGTVLITGRFADSGTPPTAVAELFREAVRQPAIAGGASKAAKGHS
jgi:hypothetical protein